MDGGSDLRPEPDDDDEGNDEEEAGEEQEKDDATDADHDQHQPSATAPHTAEEATAATAESLQVAARTAYLAARQQRRIWQMRYARARDNKKGSMPPEIAEAIAAGENVFELFEKAEGDWAKVVVLRRLSKSRVLANKRGTSMMTKQDLFNKYGDWDVVGRIIERKTKLNQYVENEDLPGDLEARLYDCFDFAKKEATDETQERLDMTMEANAAAGDGVANLAKFVGGDLKNGENKPKAKKPKKELTPAEQLFGEVKRTATKLSSLVEECKEWQKKASEDQWLYGEERLRTHGGTMQTLLEELHQLKVAGTSDGNMESMRTALDRVKALVSEYTTVVNKLKRLSAPAQPAKQKGGGEKKKTKQSSGE
jgi:hypothetical protein